MNESICVGVIGAGIISDIYLQNMTDKFDNLRVKSVSARNIAKAQLLCIFQLKLLEREV